MGLDPEEAQRSHLNQADSSFFKESVIYPYSIPPAYLVHLSSWYVSAQMVFVVSFRTREQRRGIA